MSDDDGSSSDDVSMGSRNSDDSGTREGEVLEEDDSWPAHDTESLRMHLISVLSLVRYDPPSANIREADRVIDLSQFLDIGKLVGKGKYGDVYKAVWVNTPPDAAKLPNAAIKVMRVPIFRDSEDKKRLKRIKRIKRELKVWQSLSHENVLPLIGVAYLHGDPNQPCIISKWMTNGASSVSMLTNFTNLRAAKTTGNVMDFLKRNPWEPIKDILLGIAKGLDYLHQLGIVHGDLKGDNIVVDQYGNVFICDFGLSRMMEESTLFQTSATHAGGTVRWCAPELITGDQTTVTKEADIYAYAMTSFQILSGQPPFAHLRHEGAVIAAVAFNAERPDRTLIPFVQEALWSLWEECWHENPTLRPLCSRVVDILSSLDDFSATICPILIQTDGEIAYLKFSPDGKILASGQWDGRLFLWNTRDGTLRGGEYLGHFSFIQSVAFSLDHTKIVSGSYEGDIVLWNIDDPFPVFQIREHNGDCIWGLVFSPDGSWFVSCGSDGVVGIWDALDGSERRQYNYLATEVHVSADGQKLIAATMTGFVIWDLTTQNPIPQEVSLWAAARDSEIYNQTNGTKLSLRANGDIIAAHEVLGSIKLYSLSQERVVSDFTLGIRDHWGHFIGTSGSGFVACRTARGVETISRVFNLATGRWAVLRKDDLTLQTDYARRLGEISWNGKQIALRMPDGAQILILMTVY